VDLVFMARARFEERLPALASLPATVAREGKLIYESHEPVDQPSSSMASDKRVCRDRQCRTR
jgi:hypothetical protein